MTRAEPGPEATGASGGSWVPSGPTAPQDSSEQRPQSTAGTYRAKRGPGYPGTRNWGPHGRKPPPFYSLLNTPGMSVSLGTNPWGRGANGHKNCSQQ